MGDVTTQSTIWKFVGRVSTITGQVSFALGSSYDMSFGKLGYGGFLVYLLVCLIMWRLVVGDVRIRFSEGVQGVMSALIFVVVCVISVVLEKYVPQKSDAFTITSYGSFALMSVSLSRKLELGFETGFSAFFLQLLASQLFKIKWFLFPIALVFCFIIIMLRHYSESGIQLLRHFLESGVQFLRHYPASEVQEVGSIPSNNGSNPLPNSVATDIESQYSRLSSTSSQDLEESSESQYSSLSSTSINQDLEEFYHTPSFPARQDSPGMGEVLGQSLLSTDNQQNNQEESSQSTHHSPRIIQVSDESILDWVNPNPEEEDPWSLPPPESWEQEQVLSGNNQNGWMHSSGEAGLFSAEPPGPRRRTRWMTSTGIQSIPSHVGATLGRWRGQVVPAFFF